MSDTHVTVTEKFRSVGTEQVYNWGLHGHGIRCKIRRQDAGRPQWLNEWSQRWSQQPADAWEFDVGVLFNHFAPGNRDSWAEIKALPESADRLDPEHLQAFLALPEESREVELTLRIPMEMAAEHVLSETLCRVFDSTARGPRWRSGFDMGERNILRSAARVMTVDQAYGLVRSGVMVELLGSIDTVAASEGHKQELLKWLANQPLSYERALEELKDGDMVLVRDTVENRYWMAPGAGYTTVESMAYRYRWGAIKTMSHRADTVFVKPEKLPDGKKCRIEWFLPANVIELLRETPENPQVRTQVWSKVLEPIPDELLTFEAIKDWIEANFPKEGAPLTAQPPAPGAADDIPFNINDHGSIAYRADYSEMEIGRCTYTQRRSGRGNYVLTQERLSEICGNYEGENIDTLIQSILDAMEEEVMENEPETDGGEVYHDDYDSQDVRDREVRITSPAGLRNILHNWIRRNEPEVYNELTGEDED